MLKDRLWREDAGKHGIVAQRKRGHQRPGGANFGFRVHRAVQLNQQIEIGTRFAIPAGARAEQNQPGQPSTVMAAQRLLELFHSGNYRKGEHGGILHLGEARSAAILDILRLRRIAQPSRCLAARNYAVRIAQMLAKLAR